jgi:hypothetical protein
MRAACRSRKISPNGWPMTEMAAKLEYKVTAQRVDARGSLARTKDAEIVLDTAMAGRADAFNPAELFLAAIAACMIKGIERVTPMLKFASRCVCTASARMLHPRWSRSIMSLSSIPSRATSGLTCYIPTSANMERSPTRWRKPRSSKVSSREKHKSLAPHLVDVSDRRRLSEVESKSKY